MNNPAHPSQPHEHAEPSDEEFDPGEWLATIGTEPSEVIRLSPESQMMTNELTRLTAEAVNRLNAGEALPGIASLVAIPPLVGNLLGVIAKNLEQHTPVSDNDVIADGIYL